MVNISIVSFDKFMSFLGIASGSNQHQHATEENRQAIILFAIVVLFFICHLFRNFLSLHEALTFEQKKQDYFHGCGGMPFGILIIGLVSHLLLTCNSACNFFLYCAMSEQFRTELRKVLQIPIPPRTRLEHLEMPAKKNTSHSNTPQPNSHHPGAQLRSQHQQQGVTLGIADNVSPDQPIYRNGTSHPLRPLLEANGTKASEVKLSNGCQKVTASINNPATITRLENNVLTTSL